MVISSINEGTDQTKTGNSNPVESPEAIAGMLNSEGSWIRLIADTLLHSRMRMSVGFEVLMLGHFREDFVTLCDF